LRSLNDDTGISEDPDGVLKSPEGIVERETADFGIRRTHIVVDPLVMPQLGR